MKCGHDPYSDICEDCAACLGCDAHSDTCPQVAGRPSLAPTEKSCIIGGCGRCDDCRALAEGDLEADR